MFVSDLIKSNEGFRGKVYTCSEGKKTVGWGRNLEDNGITEMEADVLLDNDLEMLTTFLSAHGLLGKFNQPQEAVLYDMAYQMGMSGLLKFKKMLKAMKDGDFNQAAHELLDSKYARQTPNRANRNAQLLRIDA